MVWIARTYLAALAAAWWPLAAEWAVVFNTHPLPYQLALTGVVGAAGWVLTAWDTI